LRNTITGRIDAAHVYYGGRNYIGWSMFVGLQEPLVYPSNLQTMIFTRHYSGDRVNATVVSPVSTRTGGDRSDEQDLGKFMETESGGQPVLLSCSFQFRFLRERVPDVYLAFKSLRGALVRYELLGRNAIAVTAQRFTANEFWRSRKKISDQMRFMLNETIFKDGYAEVVYFYIERVDFAPKYEASITAIQVAEQLRTTRKYSQGVAEVQQQIEVLRRPDRTSRSGEKRLDARARP
jgi:hypothetical protein